MQPKYKKILYGAALTEGSSKVFDHALGLAQQYGARVIVVHALEPLTRFGQSLVETYVSPETNKSIHEKNIAQVRSTVEASLAQFCEDGVCRDPEGANRILATVVEEGRPDQVILEQARKHGADLIVIGSHRHSMARDTFLGGTALRVMHQSEIPVLLVSLVGNQVK